MVSKMTSRRDGRKYREYGHAAGLKNISCHCLVGRTIYKSCVGPFARELQAYQLIDG